MRTAPNPSRQINVAKNAHDPQRCLMLYSNDAGDHSHGRRFCGPHRRHNHRHPQSQWRGSDNPRQHLLTGVDPRTRRYLFLLWQQEMLPLLRPRFLVGGSAERVRERGVAASARTRSGWRSSWSPRDGAGARGEQLGRKDVQSGFSRARLLGGHDQELSWGGED